MADQPLIPGPGTALAGVRMKQFLLLIALGNHGSIRKAADEMSISQPAASKSLLEMESVLGVQLFERTHSGLAPTEAGRCAIEHAQGIVGALRRMKYELDVIRHNRQGILRIGMIMGAVTGAFCDVVRRACESRHGLMVDAQEGTTAELMLKLRSGELDLVFARSGAADGQPDIESRLLDTEPVCIAAGVHHELDAEGVYGCDELIKYPWVGYDETAPMAALLTNWFEDHVGQPPVIKLRTTSALVTVATLCNTDCLAMLPSSVFKHVASVDRIKKIKTSSSLSLGDYSAYWHKQSLRLDIIASVMDFG
jgi:DNA-binding transcriptional LysR family regulator